MSVPVVRLTDLLAQVRRDAGVLCLSERGLLDAATLDLVLDLVEQRSGLREELGNVDHHAVTQRVTHQRARRDEL